MRTIARALLLPWLLSVAACGAAVVPGDGGGDDATTDAVSSPLTADETALLGDWILGRAWNDQSTVLFIEGFRADHTSTLLIQATSNTCGSVGTFRLDRTWSAAGGTLSFGAAPTCNATTTTCTVPGGVPACDGLTVPHALAYSITGSLLTLGMDGVGEGGTYQGR